MSIGRFYGGIAALIRSPHGGRYLLLKRASHKDFASDVWECVTGRVDQGEGFEDAVHREVREELGVEVQIEFIIGTTHFFRGDAQPDNELIGVVYECTVADPDAIRISAEHSELTWVTAGEVYATLRDDDPSTLWIRRVIKRAEALRRLVSPELADFYRETGFELG